jgi:hypothetical protein
MSSTGDALTAATAYIARFGWGTQGKMLGISKMFHENDTVLLKRGKVVASYRPRGVLSGFLAVTPALRAAVYIPPISGKMQHRVLRLRLSDELLREGAVLSCYWNGDELVLEDVLAWGSQSIWHSHAFEDRLGVFMRKFCEDWQPDPVVQECRIRLAEFTSLTDLQPSGDREVVEFVPNAPNTKRLIWAPAAGEESATAEPVNLTLLARRESAIGPDIFTLWGAATSGGQEKVGMALVRTLAISKILRLHPSTEFPVQTIWNKRFERHEIVGVAA